jgi:enoyl-CoA hydratase
MSEGRVHYAVVGGIATVVFDRPEARNAMTWAMYGALASACEQIASDDSVRAAVFRGAGGAFVAGTDIQQFTSFAGADDGIAYEKRIDAAITQIEDLPKPVIAVVEGFCVGGGLAIASACDFRIAATGAHFGVPIARTLGNCLSIANYACLAATLGLARTKRMLLLAEMLAADELLTAGFLTEIIAPAELDAKVDKLCERLAGNAPITMRVTKEAMRRLLHAGMPDGEDLIRQCYGSQDFHIGVESFMEKREPRWTGK